VPAKKVPKNHAIFGPKAFNMTLLYRDEFFMRHITGRHPERPERLHSVNACLDRLGLTQRCRPGKFRCLNEDDVAKVHERAVFARAKQIADRGGGLLDADTPVCPESVDVALAAAGACVSAVDAVLQGEDKTALCLVRPPGHHATPRHSMGFCLFNNVALAAFHARSCHQLDRILIVDWDVHHGNGTQDVFYSDGQISFFSIHRYGGGFYPGTGAASETGSGNGLGKIVNVPMSFGISRADYVRHFAGTLQPFADKVKPQLILVSAGFDAHHADPIGSLGLEAEDFAELTRHVLDIAEVQCGGRVVSCLEGGYDLAALAASVQAHLEVLLG
jgi:acetoin utilization deacetylase AcuC-like enzyme